MDESYMRRALEIARYAEGRTSPNPLVGAVVVNHGRIVGMGWHRKAGTEHAEIHALRQAGQLAQGAEIYVTLEPCSHYGRTPPCSQALIDAGVKKVVVAMKDPNPLVAGNGLAMLKSAGIEVIEGILGNEAAVLNEVFLKWITEKMPFTVLKTAMTLDGKIAAYTGASKWITNEVSRRYVHKLRDKYDGILVGIGTVLADNPSLTTRLADGEGKNPIRIIVDSKGRTPLNARVLTDNMAQSIIAVTEEAPQENIRALEAQGAVVLIVNERGHVDLRKLFAMLAGKNITSLLIEGGAEINYSLVQARLIDKVHAFIAPKLLGGRTALSPVGGQGAAELDNALQLYDITAENLAGDILITGYAKRR